MTSWHLTVLRDAAIVYGLTFAAGIGMALAGITLQSDPAAAYLSNLLSGALGFLMSGIRAVSYRVEHLAWVAATLWACNLINIVLGSRAPDPGSTVASRLSSWPFLAEPFP